MPRKSKTQALSDGIAGQHLALAVAAHLARTQLVPEPLKFYDAQHLSEMLDLMAIALARTAPLYVIEPLSAQPRQLTPGELEGATARRGATVLVLRDGRSLGGVSVRRADLRQAIAVLKAVGLQDIAPQLAPREEQEAQKQKPAVGVAELRARLAEVEALLRPPLLGGHVERAKGAAVWIARHAKSGRTANLAMQLVSALHDPRSMEEVPGGFRLALARLRVALDEEANLSK